MDQLAAAPSGVGGCFLRSPAHRLPPCLVSDLTELQVAVSDVNGRYEALGAELKERLTRQRASLELRQNARQGAEELKSWLTHREQSLKPGRTASPSKPEVVRAQAEENKVRDPRWDADAPVSVGFTDVLWCCRRCCRSWPSTPGRWRS